MTATILDSKFTFGDFPADVDATEVALEAGTDQATATAMIQAAWAQAEAFTGRCYRDVTAGEVIVRTRGNVMFSWPRYPFPDAVTVEAYFSGWAEVSATYLAGEVDLEGFTEYRIRQVGTVSADPVPATVLRAVRNLALYQLIHSPERREFKSQNAGDSGFSREALMGVMYGSGAGALLAGEARL